MTKEQIIKGNKLIAKFDGLDGSIYTDKGWYDACKYHKSWDWLMYVVEKIESSFNASKKAPYGYSVYINSWQCKITNLYTKEDIVPFNFSADSKIMAVWIAVVKFIKKQKSLR